MENILEMFAWFWGNVVFVQDENGEEKKPEIDHRRSKAVVEMQIMGATMCPSTFEDSLPSAPPLYYIEQLLKC